MLKIKSLHVSFTKEYYTLKDINIDLSAGQKLVVVGAKESGRTALLRAMLGLEPIAKGEVLFKGISLNKINFQSDISVGYIPDNPSFNEKKSVESNLEYIVGLRTIDKNYVSVKVNNALVEYGLEYIKNKKVKDINYFERIKLALARLSTRPLDILLIDDVFSKLSSIERSQFIKQIKSLVRSYSCTTLIMVSDDDTANQLGYNKKYLVYGSLQDTLDESEN